MMFVDRAFFKCIIRSILPSVLSPHRLTAISGKEIAELVYARIRRTTPNLASVLTKENIDPDDTRRICNFITRNHFFEFYGRKEVYMNEIYDELQLHYKIFFRHLYGEVTDDLTAGRIHRQEMVYRNPTEIVHIKLATEEVVPEVAFICLARNIRFPESYIEYFFVSKEYNVSDSSSQNIAGRFIFDYNAAGGNNPGFNTLFALAEEPATTLSSPGRLVEVNYLQRRIQNGPVKEGDRDSLCTLDWHERTRVCNVVLSAGYFDGQIGLIEADSADDKFSCTKREISFRSNEGKLAASIKRYEEWMIRCVPQRYTTSYQSEYFLSRGYKPYELFTYRWERGVDSALVLDNLFGNIRFKVADKEVNAIPAAYDHFSKGKGKRKINEQGDPWLPAK